MSSKTIGYLAGAVWTPVALTRLAACSTVGDDQAAPPATSSTNALVSPSTGTASVRTPKEVQFVFDDNKLSFYRLFTIYHQLPGGKIVVAFTILPNGTVSECHLVSSTFSNEDFENRVVARVLKLKFEERNVPLFTYPNYPINYIRDDS
jgi:hypothetical protein